MDPIGSHRQQNLPRAAYRVRAADAAGNLSGYSNTASATTQAVTPAPAGEDRYTAYITGYTWFDNTPPGSSAVSNSVIHSVAAGTGTYADPITMAVGHVINGSTHTLDYPAGTRFYIPNFRRYFIVEDTCGDGPTPQNGPCHLNTRHPGYPQLDIWLGGEGRSASAANSCANAITDLHLVIQNPASNYVVVPGSVYTPPCTQQYGDMNKKIALTFDDGPDTYTQQVLNVLDAYNVDATFFATGENITANVGLAQAVVNAGHLLENHSYTHPDLTTLSNTQITSELKRTSDAIFTATGTHPEYYRPPYGEHNANVDSIANSLGLQAVTWTVETLDWDQPNTTEAEIIQSVLQGATDNGVILMHDGGGNRSQTVAALDDIILRLRGQGYELVTLDKIPVLPIDFDGGTAPNHTAVMGQAIASNLVAPSGSTGSPPITTQPPAETLITEPA